MEPKSVLSQFFFKGTKMAEFTLTYKEFQELSVVFNNAKKDLGKAKLNQIYNKLEKLERGYTIEEKKKGYYEPQDMVENMFDINLLLVNNRIPNDNMFGTSYLYSY